MKGSSWFSDWFALEDGVISVSLKNLTLVLSIIVTAVLLGMLYQSCTDGSVECNSTVWPMISDIICLHFYDRIFMFLSTFFMLGVMQVNMRAYYKKVYGYISNSSNDSIFYTGIASCIALPMIGVFDEHDWKTAHYALAGVFFGCFGLYAIWISQSMYNNKDKFPEEE